MSTGEKRIGAQLFVQTLIGSVMKYKKVQRSSVIYIYATEKVVEVLSFIVRNLNYKLVFEYAFKCALISFPKSLNWIARWKFETTEVRKISCFELPSPGVTKVRNDGSSKDLITLITLLNF